MRLKIVSTVITLLLTGAMSAAQITNSATGDVHVLRDGAPVFNSAVNGSQVAQFSLSIDVVAGDTIDFAVGPGPYGDNLNDPTGFNVTITPEQ